MSPTAEVPDWRTVPRMLRERAATAPDTVVVQDGDHAITLGELRVAAAEVARALIARGVSRGDRVAIWAPNTWQWVVAAFGAWEVGALLVPLSTRAKGLEGAQALQRTGSRLLFTMDHFLGVDYAALAVEADLPQLAEVVLLPGSAPVAGATGWADFVAAGVSVPEETAERAALAVEVDDPFEILMTSGTTGEPKGVLLTGAQILRAYWDWSEVCGLGPGDRYPIVSPFAHGFGINAGLLVCVARLATMVPVAVFDPDRALELIEEHGLTTLAGPPNLFERVLTHPDLPNRDISSLRWAIVGAASVPTELVRAMQERIGFERVTNAYGLIEGSAVTMTRPGDPDEVVASTAGRPVAGMEVRIVDDAELPLGPEEQGEVQVRGYGVTRGYWDAPGLTAAAFAPGGWLRTGDVGVLDAAGNLRIVGRKKDMFIVGGFNTYPAEIENLLLHDPRIASAAVVGVPDPRLGEVPWAYVVPAAGVDLTETDVVTWAKANMSNYKVPRRVEVIDRLPVTANGKIEKLVLAQRAREAATRT
ncbi:AMP-binding protein [Pseudonocardia lutea]|uniref:AMP-binding protein n=1 Tax=Pseudonocardia lutea TaxID=2172015 RepID=A0ABW1IDH4_9PSEU